MITGHLATADKYHPKGRLYFFYGGVPRKSVLGIGTVLLISLCASNQ